MKMKNDGQCMFEMLNKQAVSCIVYQSTFLGKSVECVIPMIPTYVRRQMIKFIKRYLLCYNDLQFKMLQYNNDWMNA